MVRSVGAAPTASALAMQHSTGELRAHMVCGAVLFYFREPLVGIEPTFPIYETGALPLYDGGIFSFRAGCQGIEPC